jgi:protocatechuate 3,4-dioxygenase beta subunit
MITMQLALLAVVLQNTSVHGVVLRGQNDPLSKATVELRSDSNNAPLLGSMLTDNDGKFVFQNVRPGRYQLTVKRQGYTRPPRNITVAAGQPLPDIQLPMSPTGAIYGAVYNSRNEPMGNVEVQAMKASYPEGRRVLTAAQVVRTNDLGEYRLFWLTPGRYYVVALHPEIRTSPGLPRMFDVGTISIVGGAATFVGTSSNVDPAISLRPEQSEQSDHYMPVYYPGALDEQSATAIDVRSGSETGGLNIVIRPVQVRHVRGVIVDGSTGKPDQYGSLSLEDGLENVAGERFTVDHDTGLFDISVLPGSQNLVAHAAGGTGYATVQVGESDIENLTIVTMKNFDIPGRVSVEGASGRVSALDSLRISLLRDPPPPTERRPIQSYSTPLPDGSITVEAGVGDFRVNIAPILNANGSSNFGIPAGLQDVHVKSIRLGNIDVLNNGLHLERPPAAPLEIVIGTRLGSIEGTVAAGPQQDAGDASVVLIPDVRRRTDLFKTTTSDLSGHFRFDRIPPGDYKIFAWNGVDDGSWFDPGFMANFESAGKPVRVEPGGKVEAQIPLL